MDRLKIAFAKLFLSFDDIETYKQSGNVIYYCPKSDPPVTEEEIAHALGAELGFDVPVFIKTRDQLQSIIATNPFLTRTNIDMTKLHATFLAQGFDADIQRKLLQLNATPDEAILVGEVVYLNCPNGYGRTKLSNNSIEKLAKVPCTTRNWNSVLALQSLCDHIKGECAPATPENTKTKKRFRS